MVRDAPHGHAVLPRAPMNVLGARTPRVSKVRPIDDDVLVGAYAGIRPTRHTDALAEIIDVRVVPSGPWVGVVIGTRVGCMNYKSHVVVAVRLNIEGDSRVRYRIERPGPVAYDEICNTSIVAVVAS